MPEDKKSPFAFERKKAWESADKEKAFAFGELYKEFLNNCKTEREAVKYILNQAEKKNFHSLEKGKYEPGAKFYFVNDNKNIILAVTGKKELTQGINIIASHIDSPRLDMKPLPLIEENNLAMLKTQYYGGIKKYQWLNIPLAIHGTIIRNDGKSIDIVLGEKEDEPVFSIPDLLPHLSRKVQGEKKIFEAIEGENLNLVVGNIPSSNKEGEKRVKEQILALLNQKYGINEEDLISAELEAVPAVKTRDVGLDLSMIGGYGHDDRACSFAAFQAFMDMDYVPDKTTMIYLVDKEEIGSFGVTGIRSTFLPNTIIKLLSAENNTFHLRDSIEVYENSLAISGDVSGVVNPMYTSVHDLYNSPLLGCGVVIEKYTGSGGKYWASDASAELMGKIRGIYNNNNVIWQPGTLGKVDEGGGGTVAMDIAELGVRVVDSGVGVLGMHSPFEIISKADLYETYKGYSAFFKDA